MPGNRKDVISKIVSLWVSWPGWVYKRISSEFMRETQRKQKMRTPKLLLIPIIIIIFFDICFLRFAFFFFSRFSAITIIDTEQKFDNIAQVCGCGATLRRMDFLWALSWELAYSGDARADRLVSDSDWSDEWNKSQFPIYIIFFYLFFFNAKVLIEIFLLKMFILFAKATLLSSPIIIIIVMGPAQSKCVSAQCFVIIFLFLPHFQNIRRPRQTFSFSAFDSLDLTFAWFVRVCVCVCDVNF